MRRPHEEISAEGCNIHRFVRQALAGVHQHQGINGMGRWNDLIQGLQQPRQLLMCTRLTSRVRSFNLLRKSSRSSSPDSVMPTWRSTHPVRCAKSCQHQVAVVLHHREQHLIPGAQIGITPAAGDEVDRLTGVAGEHDFPGAGGTDKTRRLAAGGLERFRGPGTELVGAAMDVGVVAAVVVLNASSTWRGF